MREAAAIQAATAGRFRPGRILGAGGSGVVYEAFDEREQQWVALKVMPHKSGDQRERLERELAALKGIAHPNLLRLGEIFDAQDALCLSMELVKGQSFLEYVRTNAPGSRALDEGRLRNVLVQLASGLLTLHATGRVHRDIKPENVLVSADGRAVLLDFGVMSDPDDDERHRQEGPVGTVTHMAPEQASERSVGPEADWYSVGVMLYEALTGELPFSGVPLKVLLDKQQSDPLAPHLRVADVPRDLSELCMELLCFDPARRPTGRAVLRRLSAGAAVAANSNHTLFTPLRGRESECELFARVLDTVRGGRPAGLVLRGPEGSGKSRLMAALCERAAELGASVLPARPGARRPFNALAPLAEPLASLLQAAPAGFPSIAHGAVLKRAFPALEDAPHLGASADALDPQELRTRMFAAARELLGELASRRLLVVAVDDLDEADADSLALLSALLCGPTAPALLWLFSEGAHGAGPTLPSPWLTELRLEPLGAGASRQLARDLLQGAGRIELADDIARRSRGSPLEVLELVRVAVLEGDASKAMSSDEALCTRAGRLSTQALAALRLLVVCPAPLRVDTLACALGCEPGEAARLASLLGLLGFAVLDAAPSGETVRIAHRSLRRVLLETLERAEVAQLRLALCRAFEQGSRPELELLAELYAEAAMSSRAAAAALAAGERADRALAFRRAAAMFELAARQLPDGSPEQRSARISAGRAYAHAGLGARAASLYADARAGANAAEALELGQLAAQQLLFAGQIREGQKTLRATLSSAAVTYPATPWRALLGLVLSLVRLKLRGLSFRPRDVSLLPAHALTRIDACLQAGMALAAADTVRANFFVLRALLDSLRCGEPHRVARALAIHAAAHSAAGVPSEAKTEALLQRAEAIMHAAGPPFHSEPLVAAARAQARFLAGRFAASYELCTRAEMLFRERCSEALWELNAVRMWGIRSLLYLGRQREVAERLPFLLEECRQRGDLYGEVSLLLAVQPYCLLAAAQPAAALYAVLEAQQRWRAEGFHVQHYYALTSRAAIALYEGCPAEAHERSREVLAGVERSLLGRAQMVRILARACAGNAALSLLGSAPRTTELARQVRARAHDLLAERAAWAAPPGHVLLAGLEHLEGRREATLALLQRAAEGYDAVGMSMHAACVRRRLAELGEGSHAEAGDRFLLAQGVRDPARFCDVVVPPFRP